ncbi:pyruvate kinase [Vairimorpha ceranae]|uniref:Pyruvate kinase n=1 Tax=Vairimorpha ceranae TaxID=40302 RepID=A0A0F9YPP8_9MICR|nr:pyruvate kinase [Vairimorpha ceranae]KKO74612.1 pyruvate kinase [Vairimorpha ceranae]
MNGEFQNGKIPLLTKVIITMSPLINDIKIIKSFISKGVTIFRINFSHGSAEEHKKVIENLRKASKDLDKVITICLDTKGQEFRISLIDSSEINVKKNDTLTFSRKKQSNSIFVPIKDFTVLKTGMKFYLDDGMLTLEVVELGYDHIKGKALNSHRLKNNKKANFPGIEFPDDNLNNENKKDILFGVQNNIDVIFASFILSKENVLKIKEIADGIPVYSKIEAVKAIDNIDDIIDISDGIMVARGDLGVETGFIEMFGVQKDVSNKCIKKFKPVICATQMLESMTSSTIPLRSEISDIGNAVLDEYDALMLSGETAVGSNPLLCADYMMEIINNAEKYVESTGTGCKCPFIEKNKSTCIILETNDLKTINWLYQMRLGVITYVFSSNCKLLSVINLYRGMIPLIKKTESVTDLANRLKAEFGYKRVLLFYFAKDSECLKKIEVF